MKNIKLEIGFNMAMVLVLAMVIIGILLTVKSGC